MTALSAWPPFPGPDRPTTLDTDTQAFFDHLGGTFTTEVNALADYLANAARPAYSVMAVFDGSATSDADPGAGKWRLNNATQNAATVVYADLADANGADMTAIIEAIDDSTSSTKGWLRFSVNGDRTKWLLARVTGAITTATGYRKIPITVIASSAASPMTNADEITVAFTPNGDKGDAGPTGSNGPWTQIGSTQTISGTPSSVTFSSIPASYADLMLDADSLSYSTTSELRISLSPDGSAFSTPFNLSSLTGTINALVRVTGYRLNRAMIEAELLVGSIANNSVLDSAAPTGARQFARCDGGISAIRLSTVSGTFTAGTLKLYGR